MPRSRNIKPGICQNEYLAELDYPVRYLFAVLPCFSDREGRLEDRPKKLKMQIFPADNIDVDVLIQCLHDARFVLRYSIDNNKYIQILNFLKHQHPHRDEKASEIPEPSKEQLSTMLAPCLHDGNPADSFNPLTDSLNPISSKSELEEKPKRAIKKKAERFADWYADYPRKEAKQDALKAWTTNNLDSEADAIIEATIDQRDNNSQWTEKSYIPLPATFLRGRRWEDEFITHKERANGDSNRTADGRARAAESRVIDSIINPDPDDIPF